MTEVVEALPKTYFYLMYDGGGDKNQRNKEVHNKAKT